MDPLSITASCIAILGASTATGKALNKLIALRKAPEDLQQLFNEREASRALLVVIQSALHKIKGTAVYRDNREALEQLLIRFRDEIGSLDELLEYQLTQPEANSNGLPEIRKLQWLKAGQKIRDIKQKIRDTRSGLKSAFDALNFHQSVNAYQTALQIQTKGSQRKAKKRAEQMRDFSTASLIYQPEAASSLKSTRDDMKNCFYSCANYSSDSTAGLLVSMFMTQHRSEMLLNNSILNVIDENGYSPMLWATKFRFSKVKHLLEALGADAGGPAQDGRTVPRLLLENETYNKDSLPPDPTDLFDELGLTDLHVAAALPFYSGRLSTELLVANFVSVNSTDTGGWTPLHWAASRGDVGAVKLLVEWKANVDAVDKTGITPLILAGRSCSPECLKLLIEEGADVRVRTNEGETVLFGLSKECAGFVGQFIRSGVQLEQKDDYGVAALLHSAGRRGSAAVTAALCEMGADIDSRNEYGQNSILMATFKDNAEVLETLVQHLQTRLGVATTYDSDSVMQASSSDAVGTALYEMNQDEAVHSMSRCRHWAPDKFGFNALHDAALSGSTRVMKILAEADLRGLDPLQQTKQDLLPDECFYQYRDINCVAVRAPFKEDEAAWRTLMDSARRQNGLSVEHKDNESLKHSSDSNKNDQDQAAHWDVGEQETRLDESGDESQDEETFQDAVQEL
ncbi:hypothetical protein KC351_g2384 [Hortaea werneckii]|nr:hypothetical protein KC351_g2384 [Hortaea werneckii]